MSNGLRDEAFRFGTSGALTVASHRIGVTLNVNVEVRGISVFDRVPVERTRDLGATTTTTDAEVVRFQTGFFTDSLLFIVNSYRVFELQVFGVGLGGDREPVVEHSLRNQFGDFVFRHQKILS